MRRSSFPLRSGLRLMLVFMGALTVGCGAPGPEGGGSSTGLDGPDRILSWVEDPVYQVGGFDAPDWATFGRVSEVGFDGDGNLYLLDGQSGQVTSVSPEGAFLGTVGRRGDGPGEVGTPLGMAVTPDGRVVIPDLGKRSLVVFGPGGEWIGNVLVEMEREGLPTEGLGFTPTGVLVSSDGLRLGTPPPAGGTGDESSPATRPVWMYSLAEGDSARKLVDAWSPPPPPPGAATTIQTSGGGGGAIRLTASRMMAFQPELHVVALPDGRVAVVDSVDYTVRLIGPEGGEERLRRPLAPHPVTEEIQEQERNRRLDEMVASSGAGRLRVLGGGGGASVSAESMRRMMEDRVAGMGFFPEIPVVEQLSADWDGRLWVQRSSGVPGTPGPTDVVTAEGAYLGTLPPDGLRIPQAFGPNGLAAYVELDELDVATVRVVRLTLAS